MLASLFLSGKEKNALSLLTAAFEKMAPEGTLGATNFGDILDQLRGTTPAEGAIADVIRLLRRVEKVPAMRDSIAVLLLGESEKRGIGPEVVASLGKKIAKVCRIDLGDESSPAEIVGTILTSLANRETTSDNRIGAVCECPSCRFTFFV